MPDVGGVAELGAPTGGVADPLVAADPVLLTRDGGRGKRGRGTLHLTGQCGGHRRRKRMGRRGGGGLAKGGRGRGPRGGGQTVVRGGVGLGWLRGRGLLRRGVLTWDGGDMLHLFVVPPGGGGG